MSRIAERGLDYTYLDVNILQDRKIRKLRRRQGPDAPYVYIALLCTIFREGYYIKWDEDTTLDVADAIGYSEKEVSDAVDGCIEVGLFSAEMYKEHQILTSTGIQKQYNLVCQKSKRKAQVSEYSLLIPSEEMHSNEQPDGINTEGIGKNGEEMQQSIVEYSKEDNSILYNSSSFNSEEREKQKILSVFFFKNWAAPEKETERFLAYNNTGGRCWAKMSETEREAALTLWKQEPEQPKRLSPTFLDCWRSIYYCMLRVGAPIDILRLALSDSIRYTENNSRGTIHCPRPVYVFLNQRLLVEKSRMCEDLKAKRGLDSLEYKPCPI